MFSPCYLLSGEIKKAQLLKMGTLLLTRLKLFSLWLISIRKPSIKQIRHWSRTVNPVDIYMLWKATCFNRKGIHSFQTCQELIYNLLLLGNRVCVNQKQRPSLTLPAGGWECWKPSVQLTITAHGTAPGNWADSPRNPGHMPGFPLTLNISAVPLHQPNELAFRIFTGKKYIQIFHRINYHQVPN